MLRSVSEDDVKVGNEFEKKMNSIFLTERCRNVESCNNPFPLIQSNEILNSNFVLEDLKSKTIHIVYVTIGQIGVNHYFITIFPVEQGSFEIFFFLELVKSLYYKLSSAN